MAHFDAQTHWFGVQLGMTNVLDHVAALSCIAEAAVGTRVELCTARVAEWWIAVAAERLEGFAVVEARIAQRARGEGA